MQTIFQIKHFNYKMILFLLQFVLNFLSCTDVEYI